MPGPITHLKAAYYYNNAHGKRFGGELYLGCICPDSVNIHGHAPKSKRWPAHLRSSNLDEWTDNTKDFYLENSGRLDEGYLKGYILHILTDIVWDKRFDMPLFVLLRRSGVDQAQLKAERWNEIYGYEQEQVKENWYLDEVLPLLSEAQPQKIGTLDIDEIDVWKNQVVSLQLAKGVPPKFVDDDFMHTFFKEVNALADRIFK